MMVFIVLARELDLKRKVNRSIHFWKNK